MFLDHGSELKFSSVWAMSIDDKKAHTGENL